jgi:hypothetical protein
MLNSFEVTMWQQEFNQNNNYYVLKLNLGHWKCLP